MDQQSQQRVNEAAEQFSDALVNSYKAVVDRSVSAQESSTQVTKVFFNQAINNLYAQAEQNRHVRQQLPGQQQRQALTKSGTVRGWGPTLEVPVFFACS